MVTKYVIIFIHLFWCNIRFCWVHCKNKYIVNIIKIKYICFICVDVLKKHIFRNIEEAIKDSYKNYNKKYLGNRFFDWGSYREYLLSFKNKYRRYPENRFTKYVINIIISQLRSIYGFNSGIIKKYIDEYLKANG